MKYKDLDVDHKVSHLEYLLVETLPYVEEALESEVYSKEGKKQIRALIKKIREISEDGQFFP